MINYEDLGDEQGADVDRVYDQMRDDKFEEEYHKQLTKKQEDLILARENE